MNYYQNQARTEIGKRSLSCAGPNVSAYGRLFQET